MSQQLWHHLRIPCLAVVLSGTVAALGMGMKTPLQPRPTYAAYTFPDTVPLPGWQLQRSYTLSNPEDEKPLLASQGYQYTFDGTTLTVETRYLTATKGDVTQFIRWYTDLPENLKTKVHHQDNSGAYVLLTDQDALYLSACINPQGPSTATGQQYLQSKLLSATNFRQVWGWLIGQDTIFDQRCLWSHLSLSVQPSSNLEEPQQTLEEAWRSWYSWWMNNFPTAKL